MYDGENPPAPDPPEAKEPGKTTTPARTENPTPEGQDEWPGRMEQIRTVVREEINSQFSALPDQLKALIPAPSSEKPKSPPKSPEPPAPEPPKRRRLVLVANPRRRKPRE